MPSGSYGRDVHPSIGPTLSSPEMLSANNDLEARAELDSPGSNGQRLPELFHAQGAVASSRTRLSQESHDDRGRREAPPEWAGRDDEFSNDVPESLLVEANKGATSNPIGLDHLGMQPQMRPAHSAASPPGRSSEIRDATNTFHHAYQDEPPRQPSTTLLSAVASDAVSVRRRERALWRWANTSHLDRFMRDVYDYYEGGGIICILCSNALWILETLFVAVLLTFLSQCVDYKKVPYSKSLSQVIVKQCTRQMSGTWNFGIWLYSFFFIWKSVQYFFEIRRLIHVRDFFVFLLEIPEQDMQTVSWQDIVARIMALRDQNPKTAANIPQTLRRFIGSQSKERLDAHDIANRLMRKENYLIAMINKDILNLSLPGPILRDRQLFSKTMEWYLHYAILDMAFNELGQLRQDFLRADRRSLLIQKLKQRLYFAGLLNLIFAPIVFAYVIIVYFFTYFNEYHKDPKLAAARKYTVLAEWKFREFNELPHLFYDRLHMSYPFATRYVEQFPKRVTDEFARSIAFMSGAITAVLAVCTILDSELFFGFEITKDRTVLFYLGLFGGIWALTRGMVSEETNVFNPEEALLNVTEHTHYMPDHWFGRLHSFEVKREFSELYKMRVVIFLEEIMGIITTPMLLLFSLPRCSEQIVDFFREFTIHVDGLGHVCSFAVFNFQKGVNNKGRERREGDVREDYYATKHGKMAASYYGFVDNYTIRPKTGLKGPGSSQQFHPPPAFPGLDSLAQDEEVERPTVGHDLVERHRAVGREAGGGVGQVSPMASLLLDRRHHAAGYGFGAKSSQRSRPWRAGQAGGRLIAEERWEPEAESRKLATEEDGSEAGGLLGESAWGPYPDKGLHGREGMAGEDEAEAGVLGLINQLRKTRPKRRGGVV